MNIRFWGVRGSLSAPLTPQQVKAKINAVVQRIAPTDVLSPESRERFLKALPGWLYGSIGGNTPCISVTTEKGLKFIFDAGTGIRVMGKQEEPPADNHYHLFFSHFHWDHIQGLPFFDPAYNAETVFDMYSPVENFREILSAQMTSPYFPVALESFTKNITYHTITEGKPFDVGGVQICAVKMSHPGDSYAYAVMEQGHKFVYATDVELLAKDFEASPARQAVFQDADALVIDAQYTVEEAYQKQNWGHSAFCYAIDFAVAWKIKKVFLFHHDPAYDDRKLHSMLESAQWYANYISHDGIEIALAIEGQEIQL